MAQSSHVLTCTVFSSTEWVSRADLGKENSMKAFLSQPKEPQIAARVQSQFRKSTFNNVNKYCPVCYPGQNVFIGIAKVDR